VIVLQVEKAGVCASMVTVDVKLSAIVDADVGDSELSQPRGPTSRYHEVTWAR